MFPVACDNTQKVPITASPDGPIDGALRITVTEGDGTFLQDPATPLVFTAVSGSIAGQTKYLVEADVRAGADVSLISEVVELTVSAAEAKSLGMSAGAPEPK
jgi:hypothetical protein